MSSTAASRDPSAAGPELPLEVRLARARKRRRKTVGERLLRVLGYLMAAVVLALTWAQSTRAAAPEPVQASCAAPGPAQDAGRVLLVAADMTGLRRAQTEALRESLSSYFGAHVVAVPARDYLREMLDSKDVLVVFGNTIDLERGAFAGVVGDAVQRTLPIAWIGPGAEEFAGAFGIEVLPDAPAPVAAPNGTTIDYQGVRFSADGIALARPVQVGANASLRVRATVQLPDGSVRAGVITGPGFVLVGFVPFKDLNSNLALAATVDAMSTLLGTRRPDPRVLLRLEDVNGRDYGRRDRSFDATVTYLLAEDVFMHLSLIPQMVDAHGKTVADIGDAHGALRLIERHPRSVEVVQHGGLHFRDSARNFGKSSGEAYEFFFDDDVTMGPGAAQEFARRRLELGAKVLARHGLKASVFEAPHYTMSPAQQLAANALFPVMHHAPLHHAGIRSYLLLPWATLRDGTAYAPSMLGYVSMDDPDSVAGILKLLEQLASVLPDPLVVIQYHPFMIRQPGRERDLRNLITGAKRLGYRFASTCRELSGRPVSAAVKEAGAPRR